MSNIDKSEAICGGDLVLIDLIPSAFCIPGGACLDMLFGQDTNADGEWSEGDYFLLYHSNDEQWVKTYEEVCELSDRVGENWYDCGALSSQAKAEIMKNVKISNG